MRHELDHIVVIVGERKIVFDRGVAVQNHRDVVVEMALAFDVDHDANFAARFDQLLARAARRLPVTLDDGAAQCALALHDSSRIFEALYRDVDVVGFVESDAVRLCKLRHVRRTTVTAVPAHSRACRC